MTIYEEMQALKDSVDKLHKKLEKLREEISDDILESTAFDRCYTYAMSRKSSGHGIPKR